MRLIRIEAKNIGRYSHFEYEFNRGITLISGKNKIGKSTILDAIQFLLNGDCVKSKKIEYLKKRKSTGEMAGILEFEFKGETWLIKRQYTTSQTAQIYINEELKADGAADVKKYLSDNFVSSEMLNNSNISSQKDTSKLLTSLDSAKFKIFKNIFDVSHFVSAGKSIEANIESKKADKAILEKEIALQEEKVLSLTKELETSDKESLQKDLDENISKLSLLTETIFDLTQKKSKIENDIKQIEELNALVISHNNTIDSKIKDLEDVNKSIAISNTEKSTCKKSIEDTEVLLSNANKAIISEQLKDSEIVLTRIPLYDDAPRMAIYTNITKVEMVIKSLTEQKNLLLQGKCPTCGNVFSSNSISEVEQQITDKNKELLTLNQQKDELEKEKKRVEDLKKELETKKEKKATIQKTISDKQNDVKIYESNIVNLQEKIDRADLNMVDLNKKAKEISDFLSINVKKEVKDVSSLDALLSQNNMLLEVEKKQKEAAEDLKTSISNKISNIEKTKVDIETSKTLIDTKSKELISVGKDLNDHVEAKDILMNKIPLFSILNKLNFISEKANEFICKIDDQYTVKFEQSDRESLAIRIFDNHNNVESDSSNLSGAEEVLVSVGIKVGLSLYNSYINNNPINFIALDEPDKSFEDERAEKFFTLIKEMEKEFEQILIITHKETIKDMFSNSNLIQVVADGNDSVLVTTR